MFQHHNHTLCIQAAALYNKPMFDEIAATEKKAKQCLAEGREEDFMVYMQELKVLKIHYKRSEDTYLTKSSYEKKHLRKKINKLTTGGNGRVALIEYDSLGVELKAKIEERIGYNPKEKNKERTFAQRVVFDEKAERFFKEYEKSDGGKLSDKQISQYTARASVFNAITDLLKERESMRSAFGKSKTTLWKNITEVVAQLPTKEVHKLPKHHSRLKETYSRYIKNSYVGILHKGLENDNTLKIKGAVADWWLCMYGLPNKQVVPVIMMRYNEIREENDFPTLTEQAVNSWLNQPEIARKWVGKRHGREEWMRRFGHKIQRKREDWFPNAYWAIDGTKVDWLYWQPSTKKDKGGVVARLKDDVVFDIYSEKILGWSFSETENHQDHFTAVKQAVNVAGARPYTFTYDNQAGHKSSKMQEFYGKLVARKGGVHYPNKAYAHNSPVEGLFNRFQQRYLNQFWFSDKQSPTVRTMNNKPNVDFIMKNKHLLHSKEELERAFELCVKLWNDAPHPKFKDKSRNEVFEEEAPMREEVGLLEQIDLFWIYNNRKNTYKAGGLRLEVAGREFWYEVLDGDNKIDINFREKYVGAKFIVKYDPEHLNDFIQLYVDDAEGNKVFVANAQPKRKHETIPALMDDGDKAAWREDYNVREIEYQRDMKAIEEAQERAGITPEQLIADQEWMIKMGASLPKKERLEMESEAVEMAVENTLDRL